ncbi:MAG: hypothetical protein AB1773_13880 [Pseudomonadota bacterium]|jgi:hypothetical protein
MKGIILAGGSDAVTSQARRTSAPGGLTPRSGAGSFPRAVFRL